MSLLQATASGSERDGVHAGITEGVFKLVSVRGVGHGQERARIGRVSVLCVCV